MELMVQTSPIQAAETENLGEVSDLSSTLIPNDVTRARQFWIDKNKKMITEGEKKSLVEDSSSMLPSIKESKQEEFHKNRVKKMN